MSDLPPRPLLYALITSLWLSACGPALLRPEQREEPAQALRAQAERLIDSKGLDGAPISSTELILALYRSHLRLRDRVPLSITSRGLRGLGLRRSGVPRRGDLLIFKDSPHTLDAAVILEVKGSQAIKAVGVLRGAPRVIYLHLSQRDLRRVEGEVINSYVRAAAEGPNGELLQGGYLAGELLVDVRALF